MRPLYLVAVVGTRLIGVVSMIVLSHLMTRTDFGQFALINTNALFVQMVAASWIVSIANRELVRDDGNLDKQTMAIVASATMLVAAAISLGGAVYAIFHRDQWWQSISTAALAVTFALYDITLAAKNAVGREAAYASFAVLRNFLALALSVLFVSVGTGPIGPVGGLLIGTLAPLLFLSQARGVWLGVRPSWATLGNARRFLALGLSGGLILGIYIVVNAPVRNIIAHDLGKPASGVWTLCGDLFYGPLAVVGNAYSLSQVRLMYLAAAAAEKQALDRRARSLLEFTVAIALAYSVGCFFFAADAVRLLLSRVQAAAAAEIAAPAAVQGAVLLILYSLTSIALARRRFLLVTVIVISTMAAAVVGAFLGDSLVQKAVLSVSGTVVAAFFWLTWSAIRQLVQIRWVELGKLFLATAAMSLVAAIARDAAGPAPTGLILAAIAAGAAFTAVSLLVKLQGVLDVIPLGVQRWIVRPFANPDRQ